MKTTLDLDDDLLIEAKTLAARRRTTLKAIVESALRREIRPAAEMDHPAPDKLEIGPLGMLVLKRRPQAPSAHAARDERGRAPHARRVRGRGFPKSHETSRRRMIDLLDANVLIALLDSEHAHHARS